jgi:hypothetical protein
MTTTALAATTAAIAINPHVRLIVFLPLGSPNPLQGVVRIPRRSLKSHF